MIRAAAIAVALLAASSGAAFEKLGVVAVADPPAGPDADLAELAHQLRAACRDRVGGVEDVPTMRARLLGQTSNATLSELDRAYGGALAVYQNGEFESALRTLHAIVEDLESLPETADSYSQWTRAQLRLAHAALTIARDAEAEEAFFALAKTDVTIAADPEQYSPTYRRRLDAVRAKVRAMQARRLTVTAEGREGTVFVNGRPMGTTPLALWLSAGSYRIGGAADGLRVPSFRIDLGGEGRSVVLDFALAESLRVNAGPGLALPVPRRGDGIVRAGAWLGVDRVVAVSRVFEGEAAFLLGSIYDVRRGALLREGSVRMAAGSVPAANLGALAAFLLTGQSSRDVKDRTETARERTPVAAAPAPAAEPSAERTAAVEPRSAVAAEPQARRAEEPSRAVDNGHPRAESAGFAAAAVAAVPGPAPAPAASAPPGRLPAAVDAGAAASPPAASPPPAAPAPAPAAQPAAPGEALSLAAVLPARDEPSPAVRAVPIVNAAPGRHGWLRRGAIGSAVLAAGFAGLGVQQGLAARRAYADADGMVAGGVFLAGSSAADVARYHALQDDGDSAKRNAWISAGAAAVFAATAGVLGWKTMDPADEPAAIAFRF